MDTLMFNDSPEIVIGTNLFIRVPVIIQYDTVPMLSVVKTVSAGYRTEVPIYHNDGTYLAKAVGSRLEKTEEGEKAGVTMKHPPGATVCELNGKPVFEIVRTGAAALRTSAELHTFDRSFLKWDETLWSGFIRDVHGSQLQIGNLTMERSLVHDAPIGIYVGKNGVIALASRGPD